MSILFVMIPLAVLLLAAAVWAFFWAVRTGQFDDLETHGSLVLFDDEAPAPKSGSGTYFQKPVRNSRVRDRREPGAAPGRRLVADSARMEPR